MRNYVQAGQVIPIPAPANVVSGQGVRVGVLFGVASYDAVAGQSVELAITGVFRMAKTSAQAWAVGDPIFATATGQLTTASGAGTLLVGVAVAAAANPSGEGLVRLNGAVPAAVNA